MLNEADLDGAKAEIESIGRSTHLEIATDPKTAMRGSLPEAPRSPTKAMSTTDPQPERLEPTYSSPEMRSYLTPAPCDETVATPARSTVEAADENET